MDELFIFNNASLVLRLIHYLTNHSVIPVKFLTVLYEGDDWIVRFKTSGPFSREQELDLESFLLELGHPFCPSALLSQVLVDLELGQTPVAVMQQYCIVVVSHGMPSQLEVEIFRRDFIARLGFCPNALV